MVSAPYLVALVTVLGCSALTTAHKNPAAEIAHRLEQRAAPSGRGCYKKPEKGYSEGVYDEYQTTGACKMVCDDSGKSGMAIDGWGMCYCVDKLPPSSSKLDDKKCDKPCYAWPTENCGADDEDIWSYWDTGSKGKTPSEEADEETKSKSSASVASSSAEPSSKNAKPTQTTVETTTDPAGEIIYVTRTAEANPDDSESQKKEENKGPNKAGIAAGVVVGVVVLAAAAGVFWFWLRRTRRNELEEEYKRQAAIQSFVNPQVETSSYDTRLDPTIIRRMSNDSIADNQDYSRRILKVTNA